ncbi:hypothetical protein CC80DRAFT_494387 [Byssothecium circinans]|uniref:Uncharacterized protein n=1 Tax=Byssothecium circinans TaxID=147558 RepID=A0A6A5TQ33_9PLEO|nr:hypothetical protein CC80DRAFT_494387 [Byssothecium circinans]
MNRPDSEAILNTYLLIWSLVTPCILTKGMAYFRGPSITCTWTSQNQASQISKLEISLGSRPLSSTGPPIKVEGRNASSRTLFQRVDDDSRSGLSRKKHDTVFLSYRRMIVFSHPIHLPAGEYNPQI